MELGFKEAKIMYLADDGTYKQLGVMKEGTLTTEEEPLEEEYRIALNKEATFTTEIVGWNAKWFLYNFVGKYAVPNNWLKMHGIPMRRENAKNNRSKTRNYLRRILAGKSDSY